MTSKRAVDKLDCYIETWEICGGDTFNPATNITKEDYEAFKMARKTIKQIEHIEATLHTERNSLDILQEIQKIIESDKEDKE